MIAVLFDSDNRLTDFHHLKTVRVYKKEKDEFQTVKVLKEVSPETSDMLSFRKFLSDLITEISPCRVIVGFQITGVPFHYFVKEGFEVCEAEIFNQELLDQIYEDYIQKKKVLETSEKKKEENIPIYPQPLDDEGNYYLDFIKIQENRPDISSKKALLPFLANECFHTLTVVCSHIMPWIENYFSQNDNLEYYIKRNDKICTLVIVQKS